MGATITRIESVGFAYPIEDIATDGKGFSLVYEPGEPTEGRLFGLRSPTGAGITGEYVDGDSDDDTPINMLADYLIGKNHLELEKHWSRIKHTLRKHDRKSMGPMDIALRDFAGKYKQ